MPASKIARGLKADVREFRKVMARAKRSHVAQQAAIKRKLNERLVLLEQESRARQDVQDAEMEKCRWNLIMKYKNS